MSTNETATEPIMTNGTQACRPPFFTASRGMRCRVLLGRQDDGSRVFAVVELRDHDTRQGVMRDAAQTVTHTPAPAALVELTATGEVYAYRSAHAHIYGQVRADMRAVTAPSGTATREDVARLVDLLDRWHLNLMRAACAHQHPTAATRLDTTPPCEISGYRYGSAWLVEPLPVAAFEEIADLLASFERADSYA